VVTLIATFGAAGMFCLAHRLSWVTLPTFAWRFTASKSAYWTPLWHYSSPLMPVVFLASAAAAGRVQPRERRLVLVVGATVTAWTLTYAVVVQAGAVVGAFGSDRVANARESLAAIPRGSVVVSDEYLLNHLAGDRTTYYIPTFRGCPAPEYVVAHVGEQEDHIWGGRVVTTDFRSADDLLDFAQGSYGGSYDVTSEAGALVVLARRSDARGGCTETDPERVFADPRG
jgi:hypothetical protein